MCEKRDDAIESDGRKSREGTCILKERCIQRKQGNRFESKLTAYIDSVDLHNFEGHRELR